jgi:hypothetical protein
MQVVHSSIVRTLVASLVVLLMHGAPAYAQSTAGTEFSGTHDAGGILHLTLSAAGDRITAFDVDGIAGGGCSWDVITLSNWGNTIPVSDGHFEATNQDGDVLVGQIQDAHHAEGTILVHDPVKGCETPPLRWTASVPE